MTASEQQGQQSRPGTDDGGVRLTAAGDPVERVVVVTAHPDDVDFGAAGTVATHTDAGIAVTYCVVTDGDNGGFDPSVPRSEIPGIRQAEQRAAGKQLGVDDVRFLGYRDGRVEAAMDLRRDISRVLRQVRPQRVITQSPEFWWEALGASHPDHRATGVAAVTAVYPDARNPFAHPELLRDEGLEEWKVSEIWLMAHPQRNHAVDVTDQLSRKVGALREHESQQAGVPGGDLETLLRDRMGQAAKAAGLPAGRLAEGFFVVASG